MEKFTSIRNIAEPIHGGFWGEESENPNAKIIRNGDVSEDGTIRSSAPLRFLNVNELNKSKVFKGDILMTISGNVGRVAKVIEDCDETGIPYVASNFVKVIRINNPEFNPLFVFYFLKSHFFKNAVLKHTRGVAIQNLSTKVFDEKIVPVLPIEKQNKIAIFLERIEFLKNKRNIANHKLEDLISALFLKMFGDPILNQEKWITDKMVNRFNFTGGGTPSKDNKLFWEGDIPWVSPKDMKSKYVNDSEDHINKDAIEKSATNLIPHNSILIVTRSGILQHTLPIALTIKNLTINQDLKALINLDPTKVNTLFIFTQLKFRENEILNMVKTGVTVQSLNTDDLKNFKIILPPIELQNNFSKLIKEIELQQDNQKHSTRKINELFDAVMAKSFS